MYTLTINFATKEELLAHLSESKTSQGTIASDFNKASDETATVEPKVEAPKKTTAKKTPKEAVVEAKSEPAPVVNEPAVEQQAPVVTASVTPKFDRDQAIARATTLVGELKTAGIKDADIMPEIHKVYNQAGCPLNLRISQFDDVQLQKFMPLFEKKVEEVKGAAPVTGQFI